MCSAILVSDFESLTGAGAATDLVTGFTSVDGLIGTLFATLDLTVGRGFLSVTVVADSLDWATFHRFFYQSLLFS